MPTRMCAVCRKRFEKSELNRVVMSESGEIFYDRTGKAQARGLYICRECVREAEKSVFLSVNISAELSRRSMRDLCRRWSPGE